MLLKLTGKNNRNDQKNFLIPSEYSIKFGEFDGFRVPAATVIKQDANHDTLWANADAPAIIASKPDALNVRAAASEVFSIMEAKLTANDGAQHDNFGY